MSPTTKRASATRPQRRAVIYCRISQDRTGQRAGVERQETECRKLCAREHLDVVAVFVDNNISASNFSKKRRAEYDRMIDLVRAGGVDVLVAWHPDRFTRRLAELEEFCDEVNGAGVDVLTVTKGDYDLSTASGRMVAGILGSVAKGESEQKSERIKAQRLQAAQQGMPNGGRRPFGYQAGGMKIDRREAKLVREAVARMIAGESLYAITYDWNERGILGVEGKAFNVSTMRSLLKSPRIVGKRRHHGTVIGDAKWDALVNDADWHKVQAIFSAHAKPGPRPSSLLGGFLHCGQCGGPMHHNVRHYPTGNVVGRYMCNARPGASWCGSVAITGPALEVYVAEEVLESLPDAGRLAKLTRPKDVTGQLLATKERLERELDALAKLQGEGTISMREWLSAREPLQRRLGDVTQALGAAATPRPSIEHLIDLSDPEASWERMDIAAKRRVLAAVVDRVEISSQRAPGGKFDPERVEVIPRV